jgi:hypothetical protein
MLQVLESILCLPQTKSSEKTLIITVTIQKWMNQQRPSPRQNCHHTTTRARREKWFDVAEYGRNDIKFTSKES